MWYYTNDVVGTDSEHRRGASWNNLADRKGIISISFWFDSVVEMSTSLDCFPRSDVDQGSDADTIFYKNHLPYPRV